MTDLATADSNDKLVAVLQRLADVSMTRPAILHHFQVLFLIFLISFLF